MWYNEFMTTGRRPVARQAQPNQFLPVEASVESVEHTTTSDKVFQIIYGWIVVGRYQPGDTLPSQDEMARQLNVSRVTLREALFRLSALGLVRLKHGVGTEVLPVNAANFIATLPGHLLQHPIVLSEFLEARLIAERSSVKLAVKKANEEDLRRIAAPWSCRKKPSTPTTSTSSSSTTWPSTRSWSGRGTTASC